MEANNVICEFPADECFESYARSMLKNQTQCEPLGSNITSRNCENPMELKNAFTILKQALKDLGAKYLVFSPLFPSKREKNV